MKKKLNVLYLIVSLGYGGAERQFSELVKGVSKIETVTPYVYYLEQSKNGYANMFNSIGIYPNQLSRRVKYDLSLIYRLVQIIRKNDIDIVHSFMSMSGLIACLSARICNVPVICSSIRDAKRDTSLKGKLSIHLQSLFSHILVANSVAGLKCRFKTLKAKYKIVYNGIDINRFVPNKSIVKNIKENFGLDKFSKCVVMVASMSKNKDHDTLLKSAEFVLQKYPDTVFLLLGDGPRRSKLEKITKILGIENNVIFIGYTQHVVEFLSLSDISVLMTNSAIISEGLSNSLLESMAMGLPVIGSKGGGTDEVIDHGVNGFLVEPYDKISLAEYLINLIGNDELRMEKGRAGRLMVEKKFSFDVYVNNYLSIYENILNKKTKYITQN